MALHMSVWVAPVSPKIIKNIYWVSPLTTYTDKDLDPVPRCCTVSLFHCTPSICNQQIIFFELNLKSHVDSSRFFKLKNCQCFLSLTVFSLKPTLHVPSALCDVTILIRETLVLLWHPDVFAIAQSTHWLRLALELQRQVSHHSSRRMDVFVSSTNTKHTPSDPHPTHHLCFPIPRGLWTSRCLAIHFTARSNFLCALAVNQKINGTFFLPRGF